MEHVATRSGFNKALVYKHFKDREGLFQAVLDDQFANRASILSGIPDGLGDVLVHWDKANRADPTFGKLVIREALESADLDPVRSAERKAYYARQIDMIVAEQNSGNLPNSLEPKFLFLALLAIVTLPSMLPQITQLATGEDLESANGRAKWHQFLKEFAKAMSTSQSAKK